MTFHVHVLKSNMLTQLKVKKHAVIQSPTAALRCHSQMGFHLCTGLLWLMAISIDMGVSRTGAEKLQLLETCKNKLRDPRRHSYRVKQV